jgi:hypothetical protein
MILKTSEIQIASTWCHNQKTGATSALNYNGKIVIDPCFINTKSRAGTQTSGFFSAHSVSIFSIRKFDPISCHESGVGGMVGE